MYSSTKIQRLVHARAGTMVEPPSPPIPLDLLLEIAATIVRCAATCKAIRRAVQDASFRRRIALRDVAVLVGVSYALLAVDKFGYSTAVTGVGQEPRQCHLPLDAGLLVLFEPMASRRGLIVLRRRRGHYYHDLRVCNTLTGHASSLPPSKLTGPHALLTVDDAGGSFQLVVAREDLRRIQAFSTGGDRWGPVVETQLPPRFWRRSVDPRHLSNPVVLGGTTIHWLHQDEEIIALDCNTARATLIELPSGWRDRLTCLQKIFRDCAGALQLASSPDGRLSLLVAETCVISMWTLSATSGEKGGLMSSSWTRQVVIKRQAVGRERVDFTVRFLGFGELSSTVILWMEEIGLVQINLTTKEALVLSRGFKEVASERLQICPQETYLSSLLLAMRAF